jgi:hypothetical protein
LLAPMGAGLHMIDGPATLWRIVRRRSRTRRLRRPWTRRFKESGKPAHHNSSITSGSRSTPRRARSGLGSTAGPSSGGWTRPWPGLGRAGAADGAPVGVGTPACWGTRADLGRTLDRAVSIGVRMRDSCRDRDLDDLRPRLLGQREAGQATSRWGRVRRGRRGHGVAPPDRVGQSP